MQVGFVDTEFLLDGFPLARTWKGCQNTGPVYFKTQGFEPVGVGDWFVAGSYSDVL